MSTTESVDTAYIDRLLGAVGPSSFEGPAGDVWADHLSDVAPVQVDRVGNHHATINEDADTHVMVSGHLDEIGVIITQITDEGFARFETIGGWDKTILAGQRITIVNRDGVHVNGAVCRPAIHQIKGDARKQVPETHQLMIDIGAIDKEDAEKTIGAGDPAVINTQPVWLSDTRVMSKAIDNRFGCYIAGEILRRAKDDPAITVKLTALATVHEETGGAGARAATYHINPDMAVVFDCTPATDFPNVDSPHQMKLGEGPVVSRGSQTTTTLVEQMITTAHGNDIPIQLRGLGIKTGTDTDSVFRQRGGVPSSLISVPTRYLHSPTEMCDLRDVEATIDLVIQWLKTLS